MLMLQPSRLMTMHRHVIKETLFLTPPPSLIVRIRVRFMRRTPNKSLQKTPVEVNVAQRREQNRIE